MEIKLVAYGIAREIINGSKLNLEVPENTSIEQLKGKLQSDFPEFVKLQSLKFAINEDYQTDQYVLQENDEVVIIPPVSGG